MKAVKSFSGNVGAKPSQKWLAVVFPLITLLALGFDSVYFLNTYFDGRQLTNVLVVAYCVALFYSSGQYLRRLMFVMVFLSYIGELLFCKVLGMYNYRTDAIPLYVPFGHAVVYASGFILAHTRFAIKADYALRIIFTVIFVMVFLCAGIVFKDLFSLVFGVMFFVLLYRKRWQNMYYFIAVCVIFIELTGTYFKCWVWVPKIFGYLPAANPPMGAVFFYGGGDVLLAKIVAIWEKRNLQKLDL